MKKKGVTNPLERDKQPRSPVFIISKHFLKGADIKSGIVGESGQIRPYSVSFQNGSIQETVINYADIAKMMGLSKDAVAVGVDRIVSHIVEQAKKVVIKQ